MTNPPLLESRFAGLLLGTAVGDALGLPAEGIGTRPAPATLARRMADASVLRLGHDQ